MRLRKSRLCAAVAAGGAISIYGGTGPVRADYPDRPVKIVVGFEPGSGTDTLTRLVAKEMALDFGQPVIVENRPGAGGNIAARDVARAPGDGYTLYMATRPNTIHRSLYSHFEYDIRRDFRPVGLVATVPMALVTGRHSSLLSVDDVIKQARSNMAPLKCATPVPASTGHLLCQLFQQKTKVTLLHVPYKNLDLAFADLIGGRVDTLFASLAVATPYLQAGSVRALAVFSPQRAPAAPNIPTIGELGFPGLEVDTWFGLVAPDDTPARVIEKANSALNRILSTPSTQKGLQDRGFVLPRQPNPPASLETLLAEESERWTALLEKMGRPRTLH